MRVPYVVLVSVAAVVFADILVSGSGLSMNGAAMDMMPGVCALWLQASFMGEMKFVKRALQVLCLLNFLLLVFHVCRLSMDMCFRLSDYAVAFVSMMSFLMMSLFLYGLFEKMRNVKALMKGGTVWPFVCMTVDVVYLGFIVIGVALVQLDCSAAGILVLIGVASAVVFRMFTDSRFVVWRKQETLIVESMKLTAVTAVRDASNMEDVYKELYDRIVLYFECKKPYLDSELTVNDLVKDMYSNKMYISKAISHFTGRNFCQFVNYYRVMHSVECFRENPELRVHELATMNGFNSIVSFSMAFRLFMGEPPSDWCRKERSRLLKKGK